jgi:hypothetical protein
MDGALHKNDGTREIDAELEFHLAEATDELVAAGVPSDEARERALAQLGSLERWRAQCLRQRKGRKTMLVKLQWAAIAALLIVIGVLTWRTPDADELQPEHLISNGPEAVPRDPGAESAEAVTSELLLRAFSGAAVDVTIGADGPGVYHVHLHSPEAEFEDLLYVVEGSAPITTSKQVQLGF